jgi:Cu-Zn family superoxide dismutase
MGDLGNIPVDEEGVAEVDFLDTHLEMSGENSIIGRGVIVHANEDDFITQPTGAAGPRLACGVIGVANPDILVNGERLSGENE